MGTRYFGASVARVEDPRLLRGSGRFVDDIKPGLLHAALVRSPHAHAGITAVQLEAARAPRGGRGVWLRGSGGLDATYALSRAAAPALEARLRPILRATPQLPLARERVRYVGEPVAIVVARSRAEAEDAAELVNIAYEPCQPSSIQRPPWPLRPHAFSLTGLITWLSASPTLLATPTQPSGLLMSWCTNVFVYTATPCRRVPWVGL